MSLWAVNFQYVALRALNPHSAAEGFAIEELSTHLQKLGSRIVPEPDAQAVKIILDSHVQEASWNSSEGYSIQMTGTRELTIRAASGRGLLYGVYDLLETEFGVRFLTPQYTHYPVMDLENIAFTARQYEPVFEYRNIWMVYPENGGELWAVRNRLNALWDQVPMEKMLGGVKWVGPSFVHTFDYLIPPDEYFASHPEFFSYVKGKRQKEQSQLCLSNPQVQELIIQKVRSWLNEQQYDGQSRLIVSVSPNDWGNFCECDSCRNVNEQGGANITTLIRLVNAVARDIVVEYPWVGVETLAYQEYTHLPEDIPLEPNVIIRFAPIRHDFGRSFPDPANADNAETLKRWHQTGSKIYLWNYHANFWDFFEPFPDIDLLGENFRFFAENGVKGIFAQGTQTPGGELRELRFYMLARLLWNPFLDNETLKREFCTLYYGEAAENVLEYIELTRQEFLSQNVALQVKPSMTFSEAYLNQADTILQEAMAKAQSVPVKERVEVLCLVPWYCRLKNSGKELNEVLRLPMKWHFELNPATDVTSLKEYRSWPKLEIDRPWTEQGYPTGVGWYVTEFEVPSTILSDDAEYALLFEAVDGTCDIYWNDKLIGRQQKPAEMMWNKSFLVELPALHAGLNRVAIRVVKEKFAAGIWRPVRLINRNHEVSEQVRTAAQGFIDVSTRCGVLYISEYYGRPGKQLTEEFYPRLNAIIHKKPNPLLTAGEADAIRFQPSLHRLESYAGEVVLDADSSMGSCVRQLPQPRTVGQGILWNVTDILRDGSGQGTTYTLKIRVKLKGLSARADTPGFTLGLCNFDGLWRGDVIQQVSPRQENFPEGHWIVFEFPEPLEYRDSENGSFLFLKLPEIQNAQELLVDYFELRPVIMSGENPGS